MNCAVTPDTAETRLRRLALELARWRSYDSLRSIHSLKKQTNETLRQSPHLPACRIRAAAGQRLHRLVRESATGHIGRGAARGARKLRGRAARRGRARHG